jgi:hypothetical protein
MKKFGFMGVLFASVLNMAIANAADQVCDAASLDVVQPPKT